MRFSFERQRSSAVKLLTSLQNVNSFGVPKLLTNRTSIVVDDDDGGGGHHDGGTQNFDELDRLASFKFVFRKLCWREAWTSIT